jgi:hypothetical protein
VFCVGALQLSVALRAEDCVTLIEKAGNDTLARPSLTLMTMFEYVPAFVAEGVPDS